MVTANAFWKGKRVFVTGHTGFKGSWLILWLKALGADLTGYALEPDSDPNLFTMARSGDAIRSVIGDIRNREPLSSALRESKAEIVFHLAAQSLVIKGYAEPVNTFATNVMGTVNVLDAVRESETVRAAVMVTSDKCYENPESAVPFREEDPMGGYDPYSSSKGCAELVTAAFRRSYFNQTSTPGNRVALASARAGNVIGGGDWAAGRLLPDVIRALSIKEPPLIRNPSSIRPWQHVLEPLSGYMLLAQGLYGDGPDFAGAWNFGPGASGEQTAGWVASRAVSAWGENAVWRTEPNAGHHEAAFLKLDSSKARGELHWRPRWNVEHAISETVAWHKRVLKGENPRTVTMDQIAEYSAVAPVGAADDHHL